MMDIINKIAKSVTDIEIIDLPLDVLDYSDFPEDYKLLCQKNIQIKGRIQLNKKKQLFNNLPVLYLFEVADFPNEISYYIALDGTPDILWYNITNSNEEDIIYLINSYKNPQNNVSRIFLGTEAMINGDLDDFDRMFIISKFTEGLTWGSLFEEYPFRDYINETKKISMTMIGKISLYSLRQSPKMMSISSNTIYSNSTITIEFYNGVFIAEIRYPSIILPSSITNVFIKETPNSEFHKTLPMDVIAFLSNFPYLTYRELFEIKPFIKEYMTIASLICNKENLMSELHPYIEKCCKENDDKDIQELGKEILDNIELKSKIDKLLSNSKFYEILCTHIDDKKNNKVTKEEYVTKVMDLVTDYIDVTKKNIYEQVKRMIISFIK